MAADSRKGRLPVVIDVRIPKRVGGFMRVREIMTSRPVHCRPADSAAAVARVMKEQGMGFVPICHSLNDRLLVGVVTDRDIVVAVIAKGRDAASVRMMEIMTLGPVTCRPDDAVEDVLEVMRRHRIRRLPVVGEDDLLVGIITLADIAASGECPHETAEVMKAVSNLRTANVAHTNAAHPNAGFAGALFHQSTHP